MASMLSDLSDILIILQHTLLLMARPWNVYFTRVYQQCIADKVPVIYLVFILYLVSYHIWSTNRSIEGRRDTFITNTLIMNDVLGHDSAVLRLYWAGDHLG